MTLRKGTFITFEGIDGAGKTTQVQMLADRIRETYRRDDILMTREPGSGLLGKELRRLILHPPQGTVMDDRAELLILLADRAQHVTNEIKPHLDKGGIVICDRYADSSIAYQGYGRGIPALEVKRLNMFATAGLWPDTTILLDIDPEVSLTRKNDQTRMEAESRRFHRSVRDGFLTLAMEQPSRFLIVHADQPEQAVHRTIWERLSPRLGILHSVRAAV